MAKQQMISMANRGENETTHQPDSNETNRHVLNSSSQFPFLVSRFFSSTLFSSAILLLLALSRLWEIDSPILTEFVYPIPIRLVSGHA